MVTLWILAILCAGLMGFAIQRGATCTVAAVDEMLTSGQANRLMALLEASLWVAGGLLLAQLANLSRSMPSGYAANVWTVIGGVLFGLGAWINQACVFGAVARLGSGQWAYIGTPLGFYLGCVSVNRIFSAPIAIPLPGTSPIFDSSAFLVPMFFVFVIWRLRPIGSALRRSDRIEWLWRTIWMPHAATVIIGVSFVITLLLAGRWSYSDVLADLAQMIDIKSAPKMVPLLSVLLFIGLYAGALIGGNASCKLKFASLSYKQLLR